MNKRLFELKEVPKIGSKHQLTLQIMIVGLEQLT